MRVNLGMSEERERIVGKESERERSGDCFFTEIWKNSSSHALNIPFLPSNDAPYLQLFSQEILALGASRNAR